MPDQTVGFQFSIFQVLPARRELLASGRPVKIGARAFDLLLAFVAAPGLIVPREELLRKVWRSTHVEANSLEAQITALRKALGGDRTLIETAPGRGYRFTAIVTPILTPPSIAGNVFALPSANRVQSNLPVQLCEFVGRGEECDQVLELIRRHRLVTVTGAGGMGKTRISLEVGERALCAFPDGVWIVELARVIHPDGVMTALAAALGLHAGLDHSAEELSRFLEHKRLLLIFDNCEHLIVPLAHMLATLLGRAQRISVLATSQEPLELDGERIYRLQPLELPNEADSSDDAAERDSVRLFLARMAASTPALEVDGAAVRTVAEICRRLDGLPLAIELAAARASTLGLTELAAALDDRFQLLNRRHGAPLRHRSLEAMLDWSHALLSEDERRVFRGLAVFRGDFSLEAAVEVVQSDSAVGVAKERLAALVAKSLLVAREHGATRRFCLLETTRLYGHERLVQAGELTAARARHARYFRSLIASATATWEHVVEDDWIARFASECDQVRAALDWSFSPDGDLTTGIELTIAAVPLWARLSRFAECEQSVRRALRADAGLLTPRQEMELLTALGMAIVPTDRQLDEKEGVSRRALQLAEALDDTEYQSRILVNLHRSDRGNSEASHRYLDAFLKLAQERGHQSDLLFGNAIKGKELLRQGALNEAQVSIEPLATAPADASGRARTFRFGVDGQIIAISNYALVLWLRGAPRQALAEAKRSLIQANRPDQMVSQFYALANGSLLAGLNGERMLASQYAAAATRLVEHRALGLGRVDAVFLRVLSADLQRRPSSDVEQVQALERMELALASNGEIWVRHLECLYRGWLAQALAHAGRTSQAVKASDEAIARARQTDHWALPELLRISASLLEDHDPAAAEGALKEALAIADRQGALGWHMRISNSLTGFYSTKGRMGEARSQVAGSLAAFSGHACPNDLARAHNLLRHVECRKTASLPRRGIAS